MANVLEFLSTLGSSAITTAADLRAVSSAAAAAANATANSTGGTTHAPGVKTTVHALGPGLPADVIGALRSLGGR